MLFQWLLRNNQETCLPDFVVSRFRYLDTEIELLREIECVECLFSVVGPIDESGMPDEYFLSLEILKERNKAIDKIRETRIMHEYKIKKLKEKYKNQS